MSACTKCQYFNWYILVEHNTSKIYDECEYYPDMAGKIKYPTECPNYKEAENYEPDMDID